MTTTRFEDADPELSAFYGEIAECDLQPLWTQRDGMSQPSVGAVPFRWSFADGAADGHSDVMPTMRCQMHRLVAGGSCTQRAHVGSNVFLVHAGSGAVEITGGRAGTMKARLAEGDVVAVPTSVEATSSAEDGLDLFEMSETRRSSRRSASSGPRASAASASSFRRPRPSAQTDGRVIDLSGQTGVGMPPQSGVLDRSVRCLAGSPRGGPHVASDCDEFGVPAASGRRGNRCTGGSRVPAMLVIIGTMNVEPSDRDALLEAAKAVMVETQKEEGCLDYCFTADLIDPGVVHIVEKWESEAHLDSHRQTEHIMTFRRALKPLQVSGLDFTLHEVVSERKL